MPASRTKARGNRLPDAPTQSADQGMTTMNANLDLVASASDDLVIEEFGRNALAGQAPVPCGLTGVAQVPAAGSHDTSLHTV